MIKIFLSILLLACITHAEDVTKKIKNTKKILSKNATKERKIKRSLQELSKKISQYEISLNKIKKAIRNLEADIASYKSKSKISKKKLNRIKMAYDRLKNSQNAVNKKLVDLLSKDIHLTILLENDTTGTASVDKLVQSYINETYSTILRDKFNKTKVKFFKLKLDIALVKSELERLNSKIKSLEEKKSDLKKLNIAKRDGIHKLLVLKKRYNKKLAQVRKENQELTSLLRKLNILKEEKTKKEDTIILKPSKKGENLNVRRIGNSYNRTPVARYDGPKTIAPFSNYKVIRKFGNFTDPTYKIKMFNPNVILKPVGSKNVINVLDGKVISITKTPAIGNIIIVENKNGLHTLYAKVTQIAPTIKEGRYIKKGYILGKVKDELYFEVTKNNSNINPMQLIR